MTESFAKLSSIFESAKDMTIEAAVSASSRLSETPSALRPQEISKLLNSRSERDISNGMKCVISMMSKGEDAAAYFADIVKNITSTNSKVRNLVMIYIIKYAELEPDTALLSINSIQKSLNDKSAISRAMSIKSMSDIRIPSISPILLLCIKRTLGDKSPLVRAASAFAVGKLYEIDDSNSKQLMGFLSKLLADSNPQVVAAAIKTYYKIRQSTSKKWAPIHGSYRRLCKLLVEFDEWTQAIVIEILTDYSRTFVPKPKLYTKDEPAEVFDFPEDPSTLQNIDYDYALDKDTELLVNAMKTLVYSDSPLVVLAIVRALIALTPPKVFKSFELAPVLHRLATDGTNVQISLFALEAIAKICDIDRSIFASSYKSLYPYPSDNLEVAKAKIDILSSLVDHDNIKYLINELNYWALNSENLPLASEAIKAIGKCSMISEEWNLRILKWCLGNIRNTTGEVLNELLTVIRYLIQLKQNSAIESASRNQDIMRIVYRLSLILTDPEVQLEEEARASVIWIIGEFTREAENQIGPDVLRVLLKGFASEPQQVRYQTLVLAAKMYSIELDNFKNSHGEDPNELQEFGTSNMISKMFHHTLTLAKYDSSFDTRDRARMINALLNSGTEHSQLASLFLQAPKPAPLVLSLKSDHNRNKIMFKYMQVPDWADQSELPSSSIRKETEVKSNEIVAGMGNSVASVTSKKPAFTNTTHAISSQFVKPDIVPKSDYKLQSLDEFFGSEESSSEEESEEGSEQESSEGEDDEEVEESEEGEAHRGITFSSDSEEENGVTYSTDDDEAEENAPLTR